MPLHRYRNRARADCMLRPSGSLNSHSVPGPLGWDTRQTWRKVDPTDTCRKMGTGDLSILLVGRRGKVPLPVDILLPRAL